MGFSMWFVAFSRWPNKSSKNTCQTGWLVFISSNKELRIFCGTLLNKTILWWHVKHTMNHSWKINESIVQKKETKPMTCCWRRKWNRDRNLGQSNSWTWERASKTWSPPESRSGFSFTIVFVYSHWELIFQSLLLFCLLCIHLFIAGFFS